MKIAVYGATGMVGSRVTTEAVARGHQVTALSRSGTSINGAFGAQADLSDLATFTEVADKHDVVVIASGPSRTGEPHSLILDAHRAIVQSHPDARLVIVGGAGSLFVGDVRLKDTEGFPDMFKPEAETMTAVLGIYETSSDLDWTLISPAPMIQPGERTGEYVSALDSPAGENISSEDFGVAVIDEIENPKHQGRRFTVAN